MITRSFYYNKNMKHTKNNHFVPQGYLKKFFDENHCIYKCDLENSSKIYEVTDIKKECCKRNLYTVKNKITYNEIEYFCQIAGFNDEVEINFCKRICDYINGDYSNFISDICLSGIPKAYWPVFMDYIKGFVNDKFISKSQENIFTAVYENDFFNILNQIIESESIDFIKNNVDLSKISLYLYVKLEGFLHTSALKIIYLKMKEEHPNLPSIKEYEEKIKKLKYNTNMYLNLIHYLIIQYFRTEKQINNLKNSLLYLKKQWKEKFINIALPDYIEKFIEMNEESFIFIFLHLRSIYLVEYLINSGYKLILLKNNTETPFITSDSPCINIFVSYINPFELQGDDFEIYFPISPTLALLYTNRKGYKNTEKTKITLNDKKTILQFNKSIKKLAKRYLYSNQKSILVI